MEASALPVVFWPGEAIDPCISVFVLALRLDPQLPRPQARARLRNALREALAMRLKIPLCTIGINSVPGQPPRLEGPGLRDSMGLSFSHEVGLSLAAVNLQGPIGIDVVRDETPPDWAAVARDYLGLQVHTSLLAKNGAGFAQAWADHEARLKLKGLALAECSDEAERALALAACLCQPLALPAGWVASLALPLNADHGSA
ncbi:4-phosphopantetheinyl transferase [Paucibacter sp. Y2R2-4]|uniref:4-phosphopantetheinyl transferase n=1 Tax=Paucibacter sp. Y2R2-4 TaxID=2893553 RepID=UPI0021E4C389|nr:4-phosphopantetheinyl transferase [Paucibacter sp. Y2R2-4]MCV2351725.1 4-phosphopantetheinyl transferase [Paucibacter sp. Y2R2-4]